MLVVTVPDEAVTAIIVTTARAICPQIPIIARAATQEAARHLAELGAGMLVRPELEGGLQILRNALLTLGFPPRRIQVFVDDIRGREVASGSADDEFALARKLSASEVDLEWLTVSADSEVAGLPIGRASLRGRSGVSVVASEHNGVVAGNPGPETLLAAGDRVAVIGRPDHLTAAAGLLGPHPSAPVTTAGSASA